MVTQYLISTGNEYSITSLKRAKGGYVFRVSRVCTGAWQSINDLEYMRFALCCAVLSVCALRIHTTTSSVIARPSALYEEKVVSHNTYCATYQ